MPFPPSLNKFGFIALDKMHTSLFTLLAGAAISIQAVSGLATRATKPVWETLPDTPALPSPISTETKSVNGVNLWFQKYNEATGGLPLVFDHGGLGYSAYFGAVIDRLIKKNYYVIAVDRRGHGRSTFNKDDTFSFDGFANDIYQLLLDIGVPKYNVVGWSDGAATTLAALQNSTIAPTIEKAFLFAGFMTAADTNATFTNTDIYKTFVSRCATEYATLQPNANFTLFANKVGVLESTQPNFTAEGLGKLDGSKITIAAADHDEAVNLNVPAKLNSAIEGSKLITLKNVSHFAPVQDPEQFSQAVENFLAA